LQRGHQTVASGAEDLELSSHQVLSEGQSFTAHPRATLVEIERGRVILDNDGVREQLLLDRSHRASADIPPEEREYRRDLATRLRDITDAGEDYLDRGERTGLLAEGDPTPIYEDGELVGVRIDNVRPDGFYDHFGVKDGDVLRSINGVRMNDTAGLLKELAVADEFVVDVDRADGTSGQVTGLGEEVRNMMGDLQ
jgi:type II secretory pathway component PulC